MIDHTGVIVSNIDCSKEWYRSALAAVGYEFLAELPASVTGHTDVAGFGERGRSDFWISRGTPNQPPAHVAFRASSREMVDDFYRIAMQAGGCDNGKPRIRFHYNTNYYCAFVLDPDGHNIEVVCHQPISAQVAIESVLP